MRADADAAAYAAYAAYAAAAAAADAWSAFRSDCMMLAEGRNLSAASLFPDQPGDQFGRAVKGIPTSSDWSFWLDWYQRALEGRPQNWPLLLEVAIQDNAFWEGSDAEVNARIAEIVERGATIVAKYASLTDETLATAANAYPLGESLTRDDQERYIVVPKQAILDNAFDLAKDCARHAIDDMREDFADPTNCAGWNERRARWSANWTAPRMRRS